MTFQPLEELAQYFEAEQEVPGAVIRSVEPDSPAARAGIEAGDVLVSYAGERVSARFSEELPSIYKKIADTPVGEEVSLVVSRGGGELTLSAVTEEQGESTSDEMECASWGFTARGITRELAADLSLPDSTGAFVAGVKPNGPAFNAQLFPGDRIVAIEGEPVANLDDLRGLYRTFDQEQRSPVLLNVLRRHSRRWILVEATHAN